jgi:hypothetical protein
MTSTRAALAAIIGGVVGGTLLWAITNPIIKRQIEGSVRQQLQTQLPQQLTQQLDTRLASYGITPTTIQNLARMVDIFGRAGASIPTTTSGGGASAVTGTQAMGTSGLGRAEYVLVDYR